MDDKGITVEARLLDRRRMAAALCLSENTLDVLRKRGLPSIAVPGTKKILFNPDRVVEWLESESEKAPETMGAKAAREKADIMFGKN